MDFPIEITKIKHSKIDQVDFENLDFGSYFTDHMLVCSYKNNAWGKPQIQPYQEISFSLASKVFHYGQAVFEGMKAYKDSKDVLWLFRPKENLKRFNTSAKRICMPAFPEKLFFGGLETLLNLDSDWIKKNEGSSLYIRPFMIASGTGLLATPSDEYLFAIICAPVRSYYSGDVNVLFEEKYSRSAKGGVGFAKFSGNYAGQFYPTKLAQERGFQQVVWMNSETHQNLEESGTMNVFFRVKDTLLTAPVSDKILDGITRKSVLEWLDYQKMPFEIRDIAAKEIQQYAEKGDLLEMFGTGTAAVVNPIRSFQYGDYFYELPKENTYAHKIKKAITDIQTKKTEDIFGWTHRVKNMNI